MRRAGGKESFSASPGWHLCLWAGNGPAAALAQLRAVTGQLGFWQDRISTLGSHNSRGQWRTRSVAVIEPACGLRLQLQRTLGYNQQLESNLEEKGDSRAGLRSAHGTTPYPWGPLGQWQTSGECPGFLRWGHAEALAESVRDFLPWSWKTSLCAALAQHHAVAGRLGRYNAVAILPQGAFDVQSIRTSQTTDPWAK